MKQRYIQAFSSDCMGPSGDIPSLVLRVDDSRSRFILTVTGPAHGVQHRFPLKVDRDEAWGLEDWLYRALIMFPTKGYRSLYTLRSGKIVGIETTNGLNFIVLAGHALLHDWDFEWSVRAFVSRYDLDDLTAALDALRPRHPVRR